MESNQIINQIPPVEENTEENTEPVEETEDNILDGPAIQARFTEMKNDIKTLQNGINHLIDIIKDVNNKKNTSRLIIKNPVVQKEKTIKDQLLELFPATQEYTI